MSGIVRTQGLAPVKAPPKAKLAYTPLAPPPEERGPSVVSSLLGKFTALSKARDDAKALVEAQREIQPTQDCFSKPVCAVTCHSLPLRQVLAKISEASAPLF